MDKKTIGSFIATLRKAQGMTQQELAVRLSVSNKTVSKWECNESYPEITLIPVIAEVFSVTSDEILKGERISTEKTSGEKSPAKAELQIKRLIQNSLQKYRDAGCIAVALFLTGYIALLVLRFTFYFPGAGFGIMAVFVIAGVLLQVINISRIHSVLGSEEIAGADSELIKMGIESQFKCALNVFSVALAVVLLSLPNIIIFEVEWPAGITEMTDFNWYLWTIRHVAQAAIILFWIAKIVVQVRLFERKPFGISVFSRNKKVTTAGIVISVILVILLI